MQRPRRATAQLSAAQSSWASVTPVLFGRREAGLEGSSSAPARACWGWERASGQQGTVGTVVREMVRILGS
jgi:hypothetical protein